MATGRANYLTKQTGEYLVAAELSRWGFIATTFTGNVPHYDIVAVDESGGHALVQVKAIASDSWQFTVDQFAQVTMDGQRQVVGKRVRTPYPELMCVLVQLAPAGSEAKDRFFVLPWRELCRTVVTLHRKYLRKHGGVRPQKPESLHTALAPRHIAKWEKRWDLLTKRVKPVSAPKALHPTPAGATVSRRG